MKNLILPLTLCLFNTHGFAQVSAVDSAHCGQMAGAKTPFILVLNKNEALLNTITACAKDAKLSSAWVSGIGQLHNPTLAYFSANPDDKPTLSTFSGYYELASLTGNVTNNHGHYYTHVHGVLADKHFSGIAGHIQAASVGLTVEIVMQPFKNRVRREVDVHTGFGPIETLSATPK